MRRILQALAVGLLFAPHSVVHADEAAAEEVFSGPQAGERLTPFDVRGVFDDSEGRTLDFVARAGGRPMLLVFVHEANRPSVALTRVLMDYAATRRDDGLQSAVVFLSDDETGMAALLKRARHALPQKTAVGISVDGLEGPGAYGLNRKVMLTVLVADRNEVTANFALVQPSVQAHTEPILKAVVERIGGEPPTLKELGAEDYARPRAGDRRPDPEPPASRRPDDS